MHNTNISSTRLFNHSNIDTDVFAFLGAKGQSLTKTQQRILTKIIASSLFEKIKGIETPLGFNIEQALTTRKDQRISLIAGDVFTYTTFSGVFDPVLCARFPPIKHERFPFSFDASKSSIECVLESRLVRSLHFHVSRSLKEYLFLPSCRLKDRRGIEKAFLQSFALLPVRYQGVYFPLSRRYKGVLDLLGSPFFVTNLRRTTWPTGLLSNIPAKDSTTMANFGRKLLCQLQPKDLSFRPESDLQLGINRHWPDARGIYVSTDMNTFLTVNRDCHFGLYHSKRGGDLSNGFKEFCEVYRGINRSLQRSDLHFAYDKKYGFVTWDLTRVGRDLTIAAKIRVPHLEKHDKFPALLMECGFKCRKLEDEEGCLEVSLRGAFGERAFETADVMSYGLRRIAEIENKIESGFVTGFDLPSDYSKRKASKKLGLIFGYNTREADVD